MKKGDQAKWNDLISRQAADKSTPPSAEGPWGLGDWRWMLRFRTTTWQVPGSMGFVGSERETKHHLWNCNLIDCCSHYPVEFLKLLRAWTRKSQTQRGRGGGKQGEKIWSSWSSAVQSPWSPLQLSSSREAGRQAAKRNKEPKDPHLKNRSPWCFSPCSLHTKIQSGPPLCMVLK